MSLSGWRTEATYELVRARPHLRPSFPRFALWIPVAFATISVYEDRAHKSSFFQTHTRNCRLCPRRAAPREGAPSDRVESLLFSPPSRQMPRLSLTRLTAADSATASPGGGTSSDDTPTTKGIGLSRRLCWCCASSVLDDVVQAAEMTARSLTAAPPIDLHPGYANEDGAARGMAPPERGIFEVVNKSKFSNEIIALLVSTNAADVALRRPPGSHAQLACLRQGLMPAQTVMHGFIDEDVDVIEVALFTDCVHSTPMEVRAQAGPDGLISESFRTVKAYRIRCKGKNVLLKYKHGSGLELQKGESSMLTSKKKRSVGGGIDMKTNVSVIELVPAD